jgi:hypothetical protein
MVMNDEVEDEMNLLNHWEIMAELLRLLLMMISVEIGIYGIQNLII